MTYRELKIKESGGVVSVGDPRVQPHLDDTTNVHGIADTSALATKTYADTAASAVIPSQSGNSGKFLSTDGSVVSWSSISGVSAQASAPSSPVVGQAWFDTTTGIFYVYYDGFWVEPSPTGQVGPPGVVAATAPITYDSGTQTVGIDQSAIAIAQSQVTGLTSALSDKASATDLSNHESDTTNVHGIADTSLLATKSYADTAASNAAAAIVDSAPGTLDTLNELAAALGDDPNFATTVSTQIGNKADQVGSTDIEITDATKGVILKSANGTRWRVTIDNDGSLRTTSI